MLRGIAGLLILGIVGRLLMGVMMRAAFDSVLAVGVWHQIFDASNSNGGLSIPYWMAPISPRPVDSRCSRPSATLTQGDV